MKKIQIASLLVLVGATTLYAGDNALLPEAVGSGPAKNVASAPAPEVHSDDTEEDLKAGLSEASPNDGRSGMIRYLSEELERTRTERNKARDEARRYRDECAKVMISDVRKFIELPTKSEWDRVREERDALRLELAEARAGLRSLIKDFCKNNEAYKHMQGIPEESLVEFMENLCDLAQNEPHHAYAAPEEVQEDQTHLEQKDDAPEDDQAYAGQYDGGLNEAQ